MPRPKKSPLPDFTVHNLRKRAEQLLAISEALGPSAARDALLTKAERLRRMAEEEEARLKGRPRPAVHARPGLEN
jgi:hypothetical protein